MQLAPWVSQTPDYLAAIRSGAGLGLDIRRQNAAEADAANRLRQSYAQMAMQQMAEQSRAQQAAQELRLRAQESGIRQQTNAAELAFRYDDANRRAQESTAALLERQQEAAQKAADSLRDADLLSRYRNDSLDVQRMGIEERADAAEARQSSLDTLRTARGTSSFDPEIREVDGGRLLHVSPNSWQFVPETKKAPVMGQSEKDKRSILQEEMRDLHGAIRSEQRKSDANPAVLSSLGEQLRGAQEEWSLIGNPEAKAARDASLMEQNLQSVGMGMGIGLGGGSVLPQEGTIAPSLPTPVSEIERKTKDGRRAIFNAVTKEFIRYADSNPDVGRYGTD